MSSAPRSVRIALAIAALLLASRSAVTMAKLSVPMDHPIATVVMDGALYEMAAAVGVLALLFDSRRPPVLWVVLVAAVTTLPFALLNFEDGWSIMAAIGSVTTAVCAGIALKLWPPPSQPVKA